MPAARATNAHAGLTADAIAEAALALIRAGGADAMTMRALAARLGVRAPSLYHHVGSRAELLRLVTRHAIAADAPSIDVFSRVSDADEYVAAARAITLEVRALYHAHPGLATVMLDLSTREREREGGGRGAMISAEIDAMVRLGLPRDVARHIYETAARWTMAAIIAEELPHPDPELDDARFETGLEMLLAGLRQQLAASVASSGGRT